MQIFSKGQEIKHKDITISGDINNFYQLFSYYKIITENNLGPLLEILKKFYNNYKDLDCIYGISIYFETNNALIFILKDNKRSVISLTDLCISYYYDLYIFNSYVVRAFKQDYYLDEINFNYVINNLEKIGLLT